MKYLQYWIECVLMSVENKDKVTTEPVSWKPYGIELFIELTLRTMKNNEIWLFYGLLRININSSLAGRNKMLKGPHMDPGP